MAEHYNPGNPAGKIGGIRLEDERDQESAARMPDSITRGGTP